MGNYFWPCSYEFKWYGKAASKREAFTPTTATLVYDQARSVNPAKADGNMIIEGENLEMLELLLSAYREQVKVICIDPPYNTGKDFIYRDNYTKDRKSYWEETGLTEEGVKLSTNSETSGRYHSDWLSMMHSRLLVARALLKEEGLIAVFIDDSELTNLSRLLDEVFGPEAFIEKTFGRREMDLLLPTQWDGTRLHTSACAESQKNSSSSKTPIAGECCRV